MRKAIEDFEQEITLAYPPLKKCVSFVEEDPSEPGRRVKIIGGIKVGCSSNLGYGGGSGEGGGWDMRLGGAKNNGHIKIEITISRRKKTLCLLCM